MAGWGIGGARGGGEVVRDLLIIYLQPLIPSFDFDQRQLVVYKRHGSYDVDALEAAATGVVLFCEILVSQQT
jgi:hypothetical protein